MDNQLLDTIGHSHHDAENCCNALWEQWLENSNNVTWNTVIGAIESHALVHAMAFTHPAALAPNRASDSVYTILTNVINQLQRGFKTERFRTMEDDWPSYQPKHFTSVALIHHREKHITETEVVAIANTMSTGKVTVQSQGLLKDTHITSEKYIATCKATKDISDIFSLQISDDDNAEYTKPNIILIEGAPGIGKTILSKEIAFQWANKNILQEKVLLFLISLRDPHIQQVKSLEQFVCYVTSSYQKNSTVEAVVDYLESTSGENCMIVFDGYDEISDNVKQDSVIGKIINHKILKLCGLVITSRPVASSALHDMVD